MVPGPVAQPINGKKPITAAMAQTVADLRSETQLEEAALKVRIGSTGSQLVMVLKSSKTATGVNRKPITETD